MIGLGLEKEKMKISVGHFFNRNRFLPAPSIDCTEKCPPQLLSQMTFTLRCVVSSSCCCSSETTHFPLKVTEESDDLLLQTSLGSVGQGMTHENRNFVLYISTNCTTPSTDTTMQ